LTLYFASRPVVSDIWTLYFVSRLVVSDILTLYFASRPVVSDILTLYFARRPIGSDALGNMAASLFSIFGPFLYYGLPPWTYHFANRIMTFMLFPQVSVDCLSTQHTPYHIRRKHFRSTCP